MLKAILTVKISVLVIDRCSLNWHTGRMTAPGTATRTARERARAELTREIKEEARRQLAAHGAQGLSLRAAARELGMVSSALHRSFPSRDALLTPPTIQASDPLGEAAPADTVRP